MDFFHKSVMLNECIDMLDIKPDGIYIDGTVGGAGHSLQIAKLLGEKGRLISFDRDPDAIAAATERLKGYNATVVKSNFSQMRQVLDELGIEKADGVLLDLGVSSHQLDKGERGFSYHSDAPLDMRMSQEGTSAYDIVNGATGGKIRAATESCGGYRPGCPEIVDCTDFTDAVADCEEDGMLTEVCNAAFPSPVCIQFFRKEQFEL